ncbi:MAG TPA: hypothetical protein VGI89_07295 [Rhizomicrobium sp.]|jgi:hypothetical protein
MRSLSFDLAQDFALETRPLRNLDEERGRYAPAIVMMALHPIRPRPAFRCDSFGRRQHTSDNTFH